MKLTTMLLALIATASAIPAPHHREHHQPDSNNGPTNATALATAVATATTGSQPTQGGDRQGGNPAVTSQAAKTTTMATVTKSAARTSNTSGGTSSNSGPVNAALVPDFGQTAGLQPDGSGNCKSDAGKTIPCQCPPSKAAFVDKLNQFVAAGSFFGKLAAPFPEGNTPQDALTRIDTIISTLQNFAGSPGVGCPAASAPNFAAVQCSALKATGATCNSPAAGG